MKISTEQKLHRCESTWPTGGKSTGWAVRTPWTIGPSLEGPGLVSRGHSAPSTTIGQTGEGVREELMLGSTGHRKQDYCGLRTLDMQSCKMAESSKMNFLDPDCETWYKSKLPHIPTILASASDPAKASKGSRDKWRNKVMSGCYVLMDAFNP